MKEAKQNLIIVIAIVVASFVIVRSPSLSPAGPVVHVPLLAAVVRGAVVARRAPSASLAPAFPPASSCSQ
jgi:hypothetical protein